MSLRRRLVSIRLSKLLLELSVAYLHQQCQMVFPEFDDMVNNVSTLYCGTNYGFTYMWLISMVRLFLLHSFCLCLSVGSY